MAAPIVIAVGLDTTDAQRTAKQLAEAIRSALNGIDDQSQRIGRKFQSNMTSPLDSVLKQYRSFASSLGGVVTGLGFAGTLTGIGKAAVDAAIQIDRSRQTIAALTGSVAAANAKLAELRQLASSSPGVTTTFAADLFAQFKAIGTITDSTINTVIKSIGRLNAAFTLPDPQQFARNLQQIFSQGFERSDIKEALGQVPIFEQLLEQAFGTRDAGRLRALKESGKLTAETYFQGLAEAIQTDPRFATIQESLGSRLQKATQTALTALEPIGAGILEAVLPVIDALGKALSGSQEEIRALVREFVGFFDVLRQLDALLVEIGGGPLSLKSILNDAIRLVASLRDITELVVTAVDVSIRAVMVSIADDLRGLLSVLGISVDNFIARNTKRIQELAPRLDQGFANTNRVNAEIARREQQGQAPITPGASTPGAGIAQIPTRARATSAATDEALQKAKQFRDAQLALERERVEQVNRVLKAEGDARLQEFERQYEAGVGLICRVGAQNCVGALPDRLKIVVVLPTVTGGLRDGTLVRQHADAVAHFLGEGVLFDEFEPDIVVNRLAVDFRPNSPSFLNEELFDVGVCSSHGGKFSLVGKLFSKTGGETDAVSRSLQSLVSRRHPETFIALMTTSVFVGLFLVGPASVFIGTSQTRPV